ncbi:hypothetical protein ACSZMU_19430 [Aeromonas caviae]|uniref:hypothetical protein n=2 Tax=Aeromonas caviae TaxID=648 RepID=UPI0011AF7945|nr:hypothetical protein [Aeromonas caviae]MBL0541093.1 hypothetical protein [Aeromonas caviae]MBL0654688.1 hypothetical protein [Aeromonas caviae]QOK20935.1 hypothetical protein IL332_09385 [Aeromonas caviae]
MKIGKNDVHHAGEGSRARGCGQIQRMTGESEPILLNLNSIFGLKKEGRCFGFPSPWPLSRGSVTEAVVEMGAKRAIYFYKREIKGFIPAYLRPGSVLLNLIGRLAAFTFDIFENDEGL